MSSSRNTFYIATTMALLSTTVSATDVFTTFLGRGEWFDGAKWNEFDGFPDAADTVDIETPYNTYISVEDGVAEANALTLGANTVAETCATSVQLDVIDTLNVETDLILGETSESDAILYIAASGTTNVYGNMVVGGAGSGVVMNDGSLLISGSLTVGQDAGSTGTMHVSGKVYASSLSMPSDNARIQLSPGANIVLQATSTTTRRHLATEDLLETIQELINEGKIAASDSSGGLVYAIYDCTEEQVVVHASKSYIEVADGESGSEVTRR